ncbi:MAG: hypothetical protein GY880_11445 [Planctomycetaceae bacterium]|nr:hypothetical protein [Planctomycetaceae bacterium]MCP4479674.1 hypothetical protein [Planctomycetaceae bacterium]MCP4774846.1 hypothetical protein [Planctomycetaceae bacterium]
MKGALAGVTGVKDINCDTSTRSCTFSAPKDLDVAATLNELVEGGNKHIKDWSNAE